MGELAGFHQNLEICATPRSLLKNAFPGFSRLWISGPASFLDLRFWRVGSSPSAA
jgi:hypothetical protein